MSQSLVKIIVHAIFSTKNRQAIIPADLQNPLTDKPYADMVKYMA